MQEPKLFNNLVKKAIDADKKFKEFRIPINLDITLNDLKAALFESNDYIKALKDEIERLKKSKESANKIFDNINEERIKYRNELAVLEEIQRWRKYPEEKPEEKFNKVFTYTKSGTKDTNYWHERAGKWEFKFYDEDVVAWMPLPKSPEEN